MLRHMGICPHPSPPPEYQGRGNIGNRALFLADWRDALFIHFRLDPAVLEAMVPLRLDLYNGCAYVSLVAFTQHRLRPVIGVPEFLSRPLATHAFLNLRTYVAHEGEPGIYFIAEWIPNPLAVFLGPRLYGLPYKLAEMAYETSAGWGIRRVTGDGEFSCTARWNAQEARLLPRRARRRNSSSSAIARLRFARGRCGGFAFRMSRGGRLARRFRFCAAICSGICCSPIHAALNIRRGWKACGSARRGACSGNAQEICNW